MRTIILAAAICAVALYAHVRSAANAMDTCQTVYTYDTCYHTLNR